MLKCNSINVHSNTGQFALQFGTCQKWEPAGCIGDFGNIFNGCTKRPCMLQLSWILNECNLYRKIVKYCILSEVCMIKTAPHSTVSPQMWCIKSIKGWFTHPRFACKILLSKVIEHKKLAWFVFQEFAYQA